MTERRTHACTARTNGKDLSMSARTRFAALAVMLLVPTATACSSSSGTSSSSPGSGPAGMPAVAVDASIAKTVPADMRAGGSLDVATSATLPPMTFVGDDDKTLVGFDIDMAKAIAATLGLKAKITNAGFDTIIPGLQAKRFDIALSSIGVTLERQQVVDFVSYYNGGQGFLTAASSKLTIRAIDDLCGHRVAVVTGSTQQSTLEDAAGSCAKAGRSPWQVSTFPATNEAVLAIGGKRTDVLYASISVVAYTAKKNPAFRVAGRYKRAVVGAALTKGSPLTRPVQAAVQHLIATGAYAKLLAKWGLVGNGIATAQINGAVS